MPYILYAACLCNTGKVRKNNEDNFFFDGRCLEADNDGLKQPFTMTRSLRREVCVAIFDGMGGENYGEYASFAAAEHMKRSGKRLRDYFIPERKFLTDMCRKIYGCTPQKYREANKPPRYLSKNSAQYYLTKEESLSVLSPLLSERRSADKNASFLDIYD